MIQTKHFLIATSIGIFVLVSASVFFVVRETDTLDTFSNEEVGTFSVPQDSYSLAPAETDKTALEREDFISRIKTELKDAPAQNIVDVAEEESLEPVPVVVVPPVQTPATTTIDAPIEQTVPIVPIVGTTSATTS
jgi:hypothetical protein